MRMCVTKFCDKTEKDSVNCARKAERAVDVFAFWDGVCYNEKKAKSGLIPPDPRKIV